MSMKNRFPPKSIVVAVDGSQPSWAALDAAVKIAVQTGSRLEAVYIEELLPPPEFEPGARTMERAHRDRRGKVQRGVCEILAGLPVGRWTFRVESGRATVELLRLAVPRHAQLLVMGTHGRQGSERFLMGSTAEMVLHRARIPVLAIRAGEVFAPERLLVPCNLRAYSDEALAYGLAFAEGMGAKVTALYVAKQGEWEIDAEEGLRRHVKAAFGSAVCDRIERVVREGDPREQIAEETRRARYGLVVLSGHHREQLSDLALGTTAERLLRQCQAPLLVVPASRPSRAVKVEPLSTTRS
jgi:nucleotide-binding universal stress UspA family protein